MKFAGQNAEKITGPAIKIGALVTSMEKPARHDHVIQYLRGLGVSLSSVEYIEGFMTTEGFMDRIEAAQFVGKPGQLSTIDLW